MTLTLDCSWREHTIVHLPSRNWPPSTAAKLAANAPSSREAVSQNENCAVALRIRSADALASVMTLPSLSSGEFLGLGKF
jgi:hypothetical protein